MYSPQQKGLEFPQGEGRVSVRPNQFEEMYKTELEFPEGWKGGGIFKKIPSMGEVWIFSGTAHLKKRYRLLRLFFLVASLVFLS